MSRYVGNKILLVEVGNPRIKLPLIKRLYSKGVEIDLLSSFGNSWCSEYINREIITDLSNVDEVLSVAEGLYKVRAYDGVLTWNEGATEITNCIQHRLKLSPICKNISNGLRNKVEMRKVLENARLNSPKYWLIDTKSDLNKIGRFPVVLKPTSLMGSNGVYLIHSEKDLEKGYEVAHSADLTFNLDGKTVRLSEVYGLKKSLIAEEYISGDEYSVEAFIENGKLYPLGITKKYLISEPFFDEKGHLFGAPLDSALKAKVLGYVEEVSSALRLQNTFIHAELRIRDGEPYLIETAARIAGDFIPTLVEKALNIDIVEVMLDLCLGLEVDCRVKSPVLSISTAIWFFSASPCDYRKTIDAISVDRFIDEGFNILSTELYYKKGDRVDAPDTWGDTRLGHIIVTTNDPESLVINLENLESRLHLKTKEDS